jgi:hypothetical protein
LAGADFLVVNSWGEIFFESVDLSFTNSMPSQCYKVSEYILKYSKNAVSGKIPYAVLELRKGFDETHLLIESSLSSLMKCFSDLRSAGLDVPEANAEKEYPPLLDLV